MGLKSLSKQLGFGFVLKRYMPITYEGQAGILIASPDDNAVTIRLDGDHNSRVVPVDKVWFGGTTWRSVAGAF